MLKNFKKKSQVYIGHPMFTHKNSVERDIVCGMYKKIKKNASSKIVFFTQATKNVLFHFTPLSTKTLLLMISMGPKKKNKKCACMQLLSLIIAA